MLTIDSAEAYALKAQFREAQASYRTTLAGIIETVESMRRQWEEHHDSDLDALLARLRSLQESA